MDMRCIALIQFCFILSVKLFGQSDTKQDFEKLLLDNGLEFFQPNNFEEVPIVENGDLYYNYSIKLRDTDFEVRYTIFPLRQELEDYKESLTDPNTTMINPNKIYKSMFMANILNVSQSGLENTPNIGDFHPKAVKEEFGADQGSTSFFVAKSEFAKDYEFCMMIVLHKEDMADVYVSFLGNNKAKFQEYMLPAFHSIKFK